MLDGPAAASDEAARAVLSLEGELQRLRRDPHFAVAAAVPPLLTVSSCAVRAPATRHTRRVHSYRERTEVLPLLTPPIHMRVAPPPHARTHATSSTSEQLDHTCAVASQSQRQPST
eukprot:scaffold9549_cov57-Phaeocystis_antarctica.AAC.4